MKEMTPLYDRVKDMLLTIMWNNIWDEMMYYKLKEGVYGLDADEDNKYTELQAYYDPDIKMEIKIVWESFVEIENQYQKEIEKSINIKAKFYNLVSNISKWKQLIE